MTTQTADNEVVLGRLEKLEKENRRLKCAGLAILLVVLFGGAAIAVHVVNQPEPLQTLTVPSQLATNREKIVAKEIEAESFVVTGPDGKQRAFFGISANKPDTSGLWLYGTTGEEARVVIGVSDHSILALRDPNGKFHVGMSADKESAWLRLSERSNKRSIGMRTREASSCLSFADSLGKTRAELVQKDDDACLWDRARIQSQL